LETFAKAREFVKHRGYFHARQGSIATLDLATIDDPIRNIVEGFTALPHCFTLQCCHGHFVCSAEQDPHNFEPIPSGYSGFVSYRIAYIAFCLENSRRGQTLRLSLERLSAIDPDYIQFGSADWFWDQMVNTYVLQVEPEAHMQEDEAILESAEARHTQAVRDRFFRELRVLLSAELGEQGTG